MTVQEIQEIGFEKAVFGGYDMKSVDTFLERVAEEFAAMQKENAAMKAKMKVLVDKIEEYRGVEEGMHRTLLTAQSIAQETIDKAKKEAEEIIASAKDETANKVKDTQAEINTEEQKLETARKNTAEFIAHVAKLYQSQARALAELAKGENLAPVQQTEDAKNTVYLRPETAQGIFVNFKNVQRTSRKKIPFGIGQIGKSFRNEITPGNFTFRTREFEQMELEFFCEPGTDLEWFQYWRGFCRDWLQTLGIKEDEMRLRDHSPEELSFYSKGTTDIEFLFPFGWGELWGIADRTDYDLTRHQNVSGQDLTYFDDEKGERYIPYVIEPSLGADRVVLAFLCAAYDEENIGTEEKPDMRTVLHFHPALAPVKIGVLPLSKKLNEGAEKVYAQLAKKYNCEFDDRGNIGKRYRRQDEIGTPFCVTYDFESETDGAVTVRDRDTMEQERIKIEDLDAYFAKKFEW